MSAAAATAAPSKLDVERFRKVQALARQGSTAGERQAAHSRLDAMAKAAGMSVDDAIRRCGTGTGPDLADEVAEAMRRQWHSMRANPKKVIRRSRLVDLYGSEEKAKEAVFADTPREAAIRRAVEPFRVTRTTTGWPIGSMMGWNGGDPSKLASSILDAIKAASPMPTTVRGLWLEHCEWRNLGSDRAAIDPFYEDPDFGRARVALLEAGLDKLPSTSTDDIMARLDWMAHVHSEDVYRDVHEDIAWLATLRADIERMAKSDTVSDVRFPVSGCANVQSRHGTASERRKAILSILVGPDGALPDREIARRVGVSPTTVGSLRREIPHRAGFGGRP